MAESKNLVQKVLKFVNNFLLASQYSTKQSINSHLSVMYINDNVGILMNPNFQLMKVNIANKIFKAVPTL